MYIHTYIFNLIFRSTLRKIVEATHLKLSKELLINYRKTKQTMKQTKTQKHNYAKNILIPNRRK